MRPYSLIETPTQSPGAYCGSSLAQAQLVKRLPCQRTHQQTSVPPSSSARFCASSAVTKVVFSTYLKPLELVYWNSPGPCSGNTGASQYLCNRSVLQAHDCKH